MRFIVAVFLGGLATAAALCANPAKLAALEQRLASGGAAERPAVLLEIAEAAEMLNPDRALAAAKEAQRLASSPAQRLAAQALVAGILRQRTAYTEALQLARDGLAEAEKIGDERLRGRFQYVIARTQWSLADYPTAVASFHEAIRLGQKMHDVALLTDAHTGIVTIYNEFKQPQEAQFHIEQARKYAEELGDPGRLGDFYRVYGNFLGQGRGSEEARVAHDRSRHFNALAGNERGVADALQNIGFIDELRGQYEVARAQFAEAIAIYEKLGLKRHLTNAHRQLGRVLGRMGRTKEALEHMDISLELARSVGARVALANLFRDRAIVHEAVGNLKAALDDQRELQVQNEEIFGERSRQQIAVLTARFDSERRQHEIDLLKRDQALKDAELSRVRWQRYSLVGALLLGGLAVGALVSRQRLKLAAERRVLEETRAAMELAERADAFKTRLVGIASHDLKSPLRAMISASRVIADDPASGREAVVLARAMRENGERMFGLIRDLLDMAALESGRLELRPVPVDLATIAREVCGAMALRAQEKTQALTCTTPAAGVARVSGDHDRLRQALENLVDNALKFTPAGRAVRVDVREIDGGVRVAVEDEGPGLTPDDYARMFEPFQKLSATPTAEEPSSGLGLHIAREIVTAHGGQLLADSIPGQGATFAFVLTPLPAETAG